MKKVVSVLLIIAVLFAFTACSSAEYVDTPVTVAVTDENGEEVTDAEGKVVTEVVTDENGNQVYEKKESSSGSDESDTSTQNDSSDTTNNKNSTSSGKTTSSANNATDGQTVSGKTTTAKETTTKQTTTAKTTTAKPKKRDVTVTVKLPYYNDQETELTLFYKVDGDKKYTTLETREVVLDNNKKTETFKIEDVKGEVIVYVEFKDITATHTDVVIAADEKAGTISPVTGIEIMDGGMI